MSLVPDVILSVDAAELTTRLMNARSLLHDTSAGNPREVLASQLSVEQISRIRSGGSISSVTELDSLLTEAEAELQSLPVVTLTIARPLRARFQRSVIDWFDRNGLGPARVEFRVDPGVIGGLIIGVGGRRHDYSLLKSLPSHEKLPTAS